ncbi:MAG: TldD/PmbA family protein [Planctomycetota bacterium]
MERLTQRAVEEALRAGADYADARIVRLSQERLGVRNGALRLADAPEEFGIGVRAMKDGCWGFAAAPGLPAALVEILPGVARRAFKAARDLGSARRRPIQLSEERGHVGEYHTPVEEDPFRIPLSEKIELLRAAEAATHCRSEVVAGESMLSLRREEQWQSSSEGARLHQVLVRVGAHVTATAAANGHVELRSHPAYGGQYLSGGYEHVRRMDLLGAAPRMGEEAVALCHAPTCPAGERTMILGGSQLALQIHESVGHPSEMDRVQGHEIDFAGASFLRPEAKGDLQYGSEHVNLEANCTLEHGLDTRGWDDEGVPSQRWPIVDRGRFVGFFTDREFASAAGETHSRGSSRAEGWYNPPIVRIPNLSLLPGEWDLEALLADTEDGALLVDGIRTWSIDQRRVNFGFTCRAAWKSRAANRTARGRPPTRAAPSTSGGAAMPSAVGFLRSVRRAELRRNGRTRSRRWATGPAPARFRGVTFVRA